MATNVKEGLGTSTAITITLTGSIATGSARESAAIDNSSNLFFDAKVYCAIKLQTGTPASDQAIYVYVALSEDGTNWTDNATGADAAITLRTPTNLTLLGTIQTPDAGALTYKKVFSVAAAIGGRLPRKWSVIVLNRTNITLDTSGHTVSYTGDYDVIG